VKIEGARKKTKFFMLFNFRTLVSITIIVESPQNSKVRKLFKLLKEFPKR